MPRLVLIIDGPLTSQGYNFIGNNKDAGIAPTTGDQIGTPNVPKDPLLEPLQNNGGPTLTHALVSGSPAIEGGHSSGFNTDQRGLARPVDDPSIANASGGDGADIGAHEVQADVLPGCKSINCVVGNNNDSGAGSLRDVIANVCAGSTVTFAANVRGAITLTSGQLLINKSLTIHGPGAHLLTVRRSPASGTLNFRVLTVSGKFEASISGLTFANGNHDGAGGGIYSGCNGLLLDGVAVSGNSAHVGGGIFNEGNLSLTHSIVAGNTAHSGGGGIYTRFNLLTVTESTISGNSANGASSGLPGTGQGGGIFNFQGVTTLTNSTLSSNSSASGGGGVANDTGGINSRNTIIALNTAPTSPDVKGSLTSENFNLIGSSAGATISPAYFSDQIGVTAAQLNLGPLENNGGPTMTHALLPGSRAIDKGHSSGATLDQRHRPRPYDNPAITNVSDGDGNDIGAYEVAAPPATPTPTPTPTPTATPTATPTPDPSATPIPTPTPDPTATPEPTSKTNLGNLSTRLRVETGDDALFAGMIVSGTQPKRVIIRGTGTSLTIADKLENPTLELHGPGGPMEVNDNWVDSPNKQAIIDSGVAPSNDLEPAIIATLPAGNSGYTAILRGVDNGTGIGVIEVYDLDPSADSTLANISTRGLAQTGDNVLFAGTIVVGPGSRKVIVRAIGPSLSVSGKMADPVLQLFNQNGGLLEENDNWVDSPNKQAILDTTIPPSNDLESAIVATLPGNNASYTAIVRGVNNSTGIALVEVYALQ